METIILKNEIKVFYVTADSFPDGIMASWEKLHSLIPSPSERKFFGISRPENGAIKYMAAAEELSADEAEKLGCKPFVITEGRYISITIKDYIKDLPNIGKTFEILLSNPDIDPDGYCIEWYIENKDVICMVKLK